MCVTILMDHLETYSTVLLAVPVAAATVKVIAAAAAPSIRLSYRITSLFTHSNGRLPRLEREGSHLF